ncbi:MAG: hypothetical protein JNM99_10150 [Verrucomicrobiaceae bacterium]|nr:hypothetical protein [Verrucomicrobiaceae bacterium]
MTSNEIRFDDIYGLLHSPDHLSRYADNLGKELPRLTPDPILRTVAVRAGVGHV